MRLAIYGWSEPTGDIPDNFHATRIGTDGWFHHRSMASQIVIASDVVASDSPGGSDMFVGAPELSMNQARL